MLKSNPNQSSDWDAELILLESLRWARKEFQDRICQASTSKDEKIFASLRLDATYQMAEFYFLLRARSIDTEDDIRRLAEIHNQYVVDLTKNPDKIARMGLTHERALEAIFTADTLPRLIENWRLAGRAIDQSNLARLLMGVMSTETCRKIVVACAEAGFLRRTRTSYGSILVQSLGVMEDVFGSCLRDLRLRTQGI